MRAQQRLLATAGMCVLLSGCALSQKMRDVAAVIAGQETKAQTEHAIFTGIVGNHQVRRAAQQVDKPWLAGRSQPLAREVTLPEALRANVNTTLVFADGELELPEVAERITAITGIPVHVRPDALLAPDRFLPRLAGSSSSPSGPSVTTVMLTGGPEPLAKILDRISARLGVVWRYHQDRLEFYRTETRVFNVRALTLEASAEASLGLGSGTKSEGFVSTSRTTLGTAQYDVLAVVRARIEPFLSQSGVLVAEPGASSSIVVTDTPDVLQQIGTYLERENQALTRRVRLVFEELSVVSRDSAEAGLDWNLVFSSAKVAAALAMPASGLAADSGALGVGLTHGPFKGSDAIVRALSEVGKVVRRSSLPIMTMNRRPVTHAVRTTFSYIDKVETSALVGESGYGLPSVSVSQKEETVGSLITLVPDAQDDGQILLSVAYDNTVAQPLKTVVFGHKSNPLQLQQVTIDGNGTVQQVVLQPGQPLLISGFERSQEETEGRRLNPGIPIALGGSDRASVQQLTTVMIVTAQVEEGF